MKIISWNIAGRHAPWEWLLDSDADLALLQEAGPPPPEVAGHLDAGPNPWITPGNDAYRLWRAAVVRLSDRVEIDRIETPSLLEANWDGLAASRPGSLAARLRISWRDLDTGGGQTATIIVAGCSH